MGDVISLIWALRDRTSVAQALLEHLETLCFTAQISVSSGNHSAQDHDLLLAHQRKVQRPAPVVNQAMPVVSAQAKLNVKTNPTTRKQAPPNKVKMTKLATARLKKVAAK